MGNPGRERISTAPATPAGVRSRGLPPGGFLGERREHAGGQISAGSARLAGRPATHTLDYCILWSGMQSLPKDHPNVGAFAMPTTEEEIRQFAVFAAERVRHSHNSTSLEELVDEWRGSHPSADDAAAIRASLHDARQQQGRSLDEFIGDFRERHRLGDAG